MKKMLLLSAAVLSIMFHPGKSGGQGHDFRVHIDMDRRYFLFDERVALRVAITNITDSDKSFIIYEKDEKKGEDYTTIQPVVFDASGREAEIIVPYKVEDTDMDRFIQGLKKREVNLGPSETIILTVNLRDIYRLDTEKQYRARVYFFPDFVRDKVIPGCCEVDFRILEQRSNIVIKKEPGDKGAVSPAEVVLLTLNAEKNGDWKTFIKYINVEKYITSFSEFIRKYSEADSKKKLAIENEFVTFLSRERGDYILNYEIIREIIGKDGSAAYVEVIVDRFGIKITDRYKYRFTLEREKKYGNNWLITELQATVMKGIRL